MEKEENRKQILNNKSKHVNCDEQRSQDVLQSSHGQCFTVVGLIFEPSTAIVKPKVSLDTYPSIR